MLLKLNIHFLMFYQLLIKVYFKVKYNIAGVIKEIKKYYISKIYILWQIQFENKII